MFGKVFRIKSTAPLGKHIAVEGILNIDTTLGGYLYLDGSLMSSTEIAYLDGVTAGTALASKALVLDASKGISTITSATITTLGSTTINVGTASLVEADLLKIDVITNGTAVANKAVILGASKEITTITSATITTLTGTTANVPTVNATNIDAGASGTAGSVDVFPTTASKGKLALTCTDQTGDTTVTLNANAMGQATQINVADPGAAASYVVQSTAALTLAEANVLDGVTAGTAVASKVVVLGASKEIATLGAVTMAALTCTTALTGAGAVGAPAVQVGAADTGLYLLSATQTGFSQDGVLVALFDADGIKPDSVQPRVTLGSTPVGTVTFKEYGDGRDMTTVLTLTDFVVGALAGSAASLGVGNIVYAFPAGRHFELVSSLVSTVLKAAGTAVATDTGLGSVIASGAVLVLSGTATFEDRLTGQTINTAAAGGTAVSALLAATAGIGLGISLNVAGSVKNVFLNSAGAWNADNTGNLTASGTIVLKWTRM